jgi:Mor family transcriptional regulator
VKTEDDYNSLPDKVIAAYKAISETFKFKYLFKTDDDQRMIKTPDKFFNTLIKVIEINNPHYGGFIVDVKEAYLSSYNKIHQELPANIIVQQTTYCSGRFYFLSSSAIDELILKKEEISREYFEDYAIGYNLSEKYKKYTLHIDTHKIFQDIVNNVIS